MIGTGMGTSSGFGNIGIYGQQDWQRKARDEAFQNAYARGLQMQTAAPMSATPMQQLGATAYASSALPKGSTLTGGSTTGGSPFYEPYAGLNVPSSIQGGRMPQQGWWNQNQPLKFPF